MGAFYALIALGYTMVYGVLRFINFAHGDVFMVGAYCGFYFAPKFMDVGVRLLGATPDGDPSGWARILATVLVLGVTMLACALLGVVIELLAYKPLRSRPKLAVLITAIGVSLFLEYGGQFLFGAKDRAFPELFLDQPLSLAFPDLLRGNPVAQAITTNQVLVFAVTALLLVGLNFIVNRTKMGLAMRAVSQNATAAQLMGVNVNTVISFTFALGSALAGAAGILYSISYPKIEPLMGLMPGIKAFVAAVLGGIGHLPGAAVGGLIIGVVETFVGASSLSSYRDAIAFAVLIGILLLKPAGLFGKATVEKV